MTIETAAVIFDIGGVLEITPDTGWIPLWEDRLGFARGEIGMRLGGVWSDGAEGRITEAEMETRTAELLGLDRAHLDAFLSDLWVDYLGTPDSELLDFFRSLRPRFRTGILSNSFVGAREREHAAYGLGDCCDLIIYSHEVGFSKPDSRIFTLTCDRLGVLPANALFVDDLEVHVAAAQALGMRTVLHRNTTDTIAEIHRLLG